MSLFGRLTEKRAVTSFGPFGVPRASDRIPRNSENYHSDAGETVSDRTALQLIAVNACVRLLSDSVASLPLDAVRKNGKIREEVSPAPQLITDPFLDAGLFDGIYQVVTAMALRGEALLYIVSRDSMERAEKLLPIHPDCWDVRPDDKTGEPVYSIEGTDVPRFDVVHIKRFSMPGVLHGVSPIAMARQSIGLGLAAERFGARWFGDSANPSSVLETDMDLDDEQVSRVQQSWIDSHGGKRRPAILSGGLKWRPISIRPDESQFLETKRFTRSEIAMLFGVPPHMIGDVSGSTSWGSGIEQQTLGFVKFTLRPWLQCLEEAFTALLPNGLYAQFNLNALLRGDTKSRYEAYTQARNAGWMNVDEIRELEDRAPVPGGAGQDFVQPLNFGPLGSDPLAAKEPAPSQGDESE